jgi:hypothetical protein
MVHHYDTDIHVKCFLKDACQKSELAILDASVDESVRVRRVQSHENRSADPGYGIELLRDERPVVPEGSKKPLNDSVERDVVVSRRDDDRYIPNLPEEGSGPLILSYLGPLGEVSGQDDHIGLHRSHHLEKGGGYTRPMGFAKVYVRPV